jgi:hypothetical protein
MKRFLSASLLALPMVLAPQQPARAGFEFHCSGSFEFGFSCSRSGWGRCGGGCGYGDYYGWGDPYSGDTTSPTPATSPAPATKSPEPVQKTAYPDPYFPAYGYQPVGYYYQAPSYWYGR